MLLFPSVCWNISLIKAEISDLRFFSFFWVEICMAFNVNHCFQISCYYSFVLWEPKEVFVTSEPCSCKALRVSRYSCFLPQATSPRRLVDWAHIYRPWRLKLRPNSLEWWFLGHNSTIWIIMPLVVFVFELPKISKVGRCCFFSKKAFFWKTCLFFAWVVEPLKDNGPSWKYGGLRVIWGTCKPQSTIFPWYILPEICSIIWRSKIHLFGDGRRTKEGLISWRLFQ